MKNGKKIGNEGFSLVELVIVMALIVILGGTVAYGLHFLVTKPVEECTRRIETALQGNRNTTMGKLSSSISFYMDGDKVMALEQIDSSNKTILIGSDVKVFYTYKNNPTNEIPLGNSGNMLCVEFDRSSGALKQRPGTGTGPSNPADYLQSIIIKRGSNEMTVTIE